MVRLHPVDRSPALDPGARPAIIRFAGVSKRFGTVPALRDVSLDIREGEFLCLLGPSGCGKSTLLRLLAGFETPNGGRIELDGRDMAGEPPHLRPLNMMFQSYALFPHMNVAANVGYGLRWTGLGKRQMSERVDEMLRLVRLEGLERRFPGQISGGQRQRVALARALARRPRVLLLDEPMAALDRHLREETQAELKALQQRLGTTFVVVTHDGAEAMVLADRIAVMDGGRILQADTPREVYARPADRFVAGFMGDVNLIDGTVADAANGTVQVATAMSEQPLAVACDLPARWRVGGAVAVAVRPERVRVVPAGSTVPARNAVAARVTGRDFVGGLVHLRVAAGADTVLRATILGDDGRLPEPGEDIRLGFEPDAAILLD